MKIYTEEDVLRMLRSYHTREINVQLCMLKLTPIELPTDDEIEKMGKDVILYNDTKRGWFIEGLKFMRDVIQGGNK